MNRIAHLICICLIGFIFSCETDSSFDEDNRSLQIEGEWQVMSIESNSYTSTMTSPNGESNTSMGSFEGNDINLSLNFESDGSFQTSGDYNQLLMVQGALPAPITIESRTNDFEGGGTWDLAGDKIRIKTSVDETFQEANLNTLTDTEMDFDYSYTRLIVEGTVTRTIVVNVNYLLVK